MLGHDVGHALPELRRQAESLMVDVGTVNIVTSVFDPTMNANVETLTPAYSGRMRVWRATSSATAEAAWQQVTVLPLRCALPWATSGIEPGQIVVPSAAADPRLVGKRLIVRDVSSATQSVRRVLTLVDHQD